MRRLFFIVPVVVLLVAGGFFLRTRTDAPAEKETTETISTPKPPETVRRERVIADKETFAVAAQDLGLTYAQAIAIVETAADVYDFTRVRVGKALVAEETLDGQLLHISYEPDNARVIKIEPAGETWTVKEEPIAYDVSMKTGSGTIDSSLYVSALDAGIPEVAVLEMAEAFAWTIDFATQTRVGDSFQILYEQRMRDGKDAGPGRVLAASFTNAGERTEAFYFDQAGKGGYYDGDGTSLVRAFLKAPLAFNRITSGYTYSRFHPVTQKTSPHRAIDYAAATGTPVKAVGDGTVTFAGWSGGYGNFIKIRHNDIYGTNYAHLSAYAKGIKRGSVVTQGQVIGYVGSTGFSTGPHLHYEVTYGGKLVNPLEVEFPAGDPIGEDARQAFETRRNELRSQAGWDQANP